MNVYQRLEDAYNFCNSRIVYQGRSVESQLAYLGGVTFGTLLDWADAITGRK